MAENVFNGDRRKGGGHTHTHTLGRHRGIKSSMSSNMSGNFERNDYRLVHRDIFTSLIIIIDYFSI